MGDDVSRNGTQRITAGDVIGLRARHGWTQQELADRLDVTKRTVANWEKNGVPTGKATIQVGVLVAEMTLGEREDDAPALVATLTDRVETLEQRVDYLESIVMRQRADELAIRRRNSGLSDVTHSVPRAALGHDPQAEFEEHQQEP